MKECKICKLKEEGKSILCHHCKVNDAEVNAKDGIFCLQCYTRNRQSEMQDAAISLLFKKIEKLEKMGSMDQCPFETNCKY